MPTKDNVIMYRMLLKQSRGFILNEETQNYEKKKLFGQLKNKIKKNYKHT